MVVNVAAQAVAKTGTAGAKVAGQGATKAGGAAVKAGARAGSKAGSRAVRRGAAGGARRAGAAGARQAGGKVGARVAQKGARQAGGRTGARDNRRNFGPRGTAHRPQWGSPARPSQEQGQDGQQGQGQKGRPAKDTGQQAVDAAGRVAGTAAGAALGAARVAYNLVRLRPFRASKRSLGQARKAVRTKKRKEEDRRRRRRLIVILCGVGVLLLMALGTAPAGTGSGPPPDAAGGGYGTMTGIPYADVFNRTADLGIDPRLVAAVAWHESAHFDPAVMECRRFSVAGAQGIMQFMPGTARGRGIDPCNPAEAIPAGAAYLLEIYEMYGDWELTLAGYNAGPYNDRLQVCRCVPQNGETERYVPIVMAKWEEYKLQFPSGELGSGGEAAGAGGCPVSQTSGGTAPVSFANTTRATLAMANAIVGCFGRGRGIGCYDPRTGGGSKFEHPRGRACDFMVTGGGMANADEKATGQAMAEWVMANASSFKVIYVIWYNKIWNTRDGQRPWSEWRSYNCGDCGASGGHYNHVHVSIHLQPGDAGLARCVSGIPCTE